jgi:hypothetical protein
MICVVVLQACRGFVERETGSCSVTCDVDGAEGVGIKVEAIDVKEEVSIKVEESSDRNDEIAEISPISTQNQVRLQGVCERERGVR